MRSALGRGWRRLRSWRRIRFTRAGVFFSLGAFGVGAAAINTGNNLLYLLLGAMLGAIGVSGWVSERALRALHVIRTLPAGVSVDREFRIRYEVTNQKRRLPSLAVELVEPGLSGAAFVPRVRAGETVAAQSRDRFIRRGVYPLEMLTLATEFPFGLFRKERDVPLPGELVVWPRTDRPVPSETLAPSGAAATSSISAATAGPRGEFRSLREYRPGDDARDIHWRSSARSGSLVVREYEADAGEALWVVLDTCHEPGAKAEAAVEMAASLCARAAHRGRIFALAAGAWTVEPGTGEVHLERALDALARVDFGPGIPVNEAGPPERSILVTPGDARAGYRHVLRAPDAPAREDRP